MMSVTNGANDPNPAITCYLLEGQNVVQELSQTSSGGTTTLTPTVTAEDSTGLTYMRARYYDPAIGRFVSEDPARDGVNWYAYCDSNPTNKRDRTGELPEGWEKVSFAVTTIMGAVASVGSAQSSPYQPPTNGWQVAGKVAEIADLVYVGAQCVEWMGNAQEMGLVAATFCPVVGSIATMGAVLLGVAGMTCFVTAMCLTMDLAASGNQ